MSSVLRTYIFFYHWTLRGLPHDDLPTLEPCTRSRISARLLAPGYEILRACLGGDPRAGWRGPRPSGDVCAKPSRLEGYPEARGVPSSGAGPSHNGTFLAGGIGRKSRAGKSAVFSFRFSRTRVCIPPATLHRVEEWALSGQNRSKPSYFLCPISKVRYDYIDHFVSSIPQAMIFF